jgi:putative Holliday junction resolvase
MDAAALGQLSDSNSGKIMDASRRILAVDPGSKNIGIAISDPTSTIARPLQVVKHVSMLLDAAQIVQIATENEAKEIIVGLPTGGSGELISQSRHSQKLAEVIRSQSEISVILWDENNSTQIARRSLIDLNISVSKRSGHQDALAAAVILQSYLDAHPHNGEMHE